MKSPKNRDLVATPHLNHLLSMDSKTRTLSRTKGSKEGCIRKQLLSPNSGSTWMDSVNREESASRISKPRSPQNVCFSPTIQHSRVVAEGNLEGNRSEIMAKLQELASVTTQETHYRKRTADDSQAVYHRIQVNQWESQEIDKLKLELERSYGRMKEVRKRQKETEKRTMQLDEARKLLEAEVVGLRQRCSKKDDVIFGLEQRLLAVQADYDSLHQKLSALQLQILSERNTSIQTLKDHLLSFDKFQPVRETSLHTNGSKASLQNHPPSSMADTSHRLRREIDQIRGELQGKHSELQQKQEQWAREKAYLKEELQSAASQLQRQKSSSSTRELKKERQKEDMYLLYIQAASIESLLKRQAA